MPDGDEHHSRRVHMVPVITLGNIVGPLLTAVAIAVPGLIWGGKIDTRVSHLESTVVSKVSSESAADVARRVNSLEEASRDTAQKLEAIHGEQRAQRTLLEVLVKRGERGVAR